MGDTISAPWLTTPKPLCAALGLHRYVLADHSMGGKVAQIVAARRPKELVGMVLVAPAPPTPMPHGRRHAPAI